MEHTGRRFRLGLFVLGSGGLFLALLVFILQSSFDHAQATYFILFTENVKGMVTGSRVNFQGVPIGVVADMRFQDGKTMVELRVDPTRASIQDITRARMDRLLVTGQVTVELEGYGPHGKPLVDGAFIQPKEDPLQALMRASLPEVMDSAQTVLARLDRVLVQAEGLLGEPLQQRVQRVLDHTERAVQRIADETVPAATALLADARGAVGAATASAEAVAAAATTADRTVAALASLQAGLDALLHESTAVVANLRGPAVTTLSAVRGTLDDLRRLLRQLELAPDSLLFGVRPAAPPGGER